MSRVFTLMSSWILALVLLYSGPVSAQQKSSREPTAREQLQAIDKQISEAEAFNSQFKSASLLFKSWVLLVGIAIVLGVAFFLLKGFGYLFVGMSTTTDPEKLAMSDPWVRAHLAQQKAAQANARDDVPVLEPAEEKPAD